MADEIAPQVAKAELNWAMACHLAALAGFFVPFGNLLGPLVVWLLKRADMPQVEVHGRESLNFQINVALLVAVCWVLVFVLVGVVLLPAVILGALFFTLRAAIRVSNGELGHRYPAWIIRFLK
ncbi:MAG: DUF4870 domain-containing protein [Burkholderiales bacterium]|nr:DUF4870 domain-containing protein [Burkholderiales bacterium]